MLWSKIRSIHHKRAGTKGVNSDVERHDEESLSERLHGVQQQGEGEDPEEHDRSVELAECGDGPTARDEHIEKVPAHIGHYEVAKPRNHVEHPTYGSEV